MILSVTMTRCDSFILKCNHRQHLQYKNWDHSGFNRHRILMPSELSVYYVKCNRNIRDRLICNVSSWRQWWTMYAWMNWESGEILSTDTSMWEQSFWYSVLLQNGLKCLRVLLSQATCRYKYETRSNFKCTLDVFNNL